MSDQIETPSAKIIKKAHEPKTTKDSLGRVIQFKPLRPSSQMDLVTLIGPERARNFIALSMAGATFRVTSIDGIPLFPPQSYEDLKSNMDELGDEGLAAMYDAIAAENTPAEKKDDKPSTDKKVKAA